MKKQWIKRSQRKSHSPFIFPVHFFLSLHYSTFDVRCSTSALFFSVLPCLRISVSIFSPSYLLTFFFFYRPSFLVPLPSFSLFHSSFIIRHSMFYFSLFTLHFSILKFPVSIFNSHFSLLTSHFSMFNFYLPCVKKSHLEATKNEKVLLFVTCIRSPFFIHFYILM